MNVYLASPRNQLQASVLADMPVLLSFPLWSSYLESYQCTFGRILIDSGAYSVMNTGKTVDVLAYRDWSQRWRETADAIAGLDDISGDWRQSLRNYEAVEWSFPTIHDTDPPELLDDLIAICIERKCWLGVGLMPPRETKERFLRDVFERIPENVHVHGWALRAYTKLRRIDSVDSTNWFRDAMKYRSQLPWITYAEALELVTKRYKRWSRIVEPENLQTKLPI